MPKLTSSWMDRKQPPGLHWDGREHGLGARVWSDGSNKSWVWQKSGGKRHTLGRWPTIDVAEARRLTAELNATEPEARNRRTTLQAVHEAWSRDFLNRGGSPVTVKEAAGRVGKHAPGWWSRDPANVTATDLLNLRSDIVERNGVHPARDTVSHLRRLVEQHTQTRFRLPALPRPASNRAERAAEISEWWPEIVAGASLTMLDAHLVCALTGLRQGEVLQFRRSNLEDDRVFIPQPKTKMGKDISFWRHLPTQVHDILGRQMTNEDTFFPFKSIRLSTGSYSHRLRHHFIGVAESETAVPRRVLRRLVNHTGKTDVTDGYGHVSDEACALWSQVIADLIWSRLKECLPK
ncbi:MAG: integrase family protein [Paracoccaceae bacterium]